MGREYGEKEWSECLLLNFNSRTAILVNYLRIGIAVTDVDEYVSDDRTTAAMWKRSRTSCGPIGF